MTNHLGGDDPDLPPGRVIPTLLERARRAPLWPESQTLIEPSWKGDWLRLIGFISSSDVETPHKDHPNTYVAGCVTCVTYSGRWWPSRCSGRWCWCLPGCLPIWEWLIEERVASERQGLRGERRGNVHESFRCDVPYSSNL